MTQDYQKSLAANEGVVPTRKEEGTKAFKVQCDPQGSEEKDKANSDERDYTPSYVWCRLCAGTGCWACWGGTCSSDARQWDYY